MTRGKARGSTDQPEPVTETWVRFDGEAQVEREVTIESDGTVRMDRAVFESLMAKAGWSQRPTVPPVLPDEVDVSANTDPPPEETS